jgi:2,6-dihydroxypyridine 3-monooxygenase
MNGDPIRVAIVGGSHAGLLTALALQRVGCAVDVFERSRTRLEARGAGLRIQPLMADLLLRVADIDLTPASTFTRWDRHIGPGNCLLHNAPEIGHFVSWGSLYRFLLERFGIERYHFGKACVGLAQTDNGVTLHFADAQIAHADLVVFSDGIASTGRRLLAPEVAPNYAGYVAWRGLVPQAHISSQTRAVLDDACTFTVAGLSHMPIYPVPGDAEVDIDGGRLLNFIWYRNVAPGRDLDELMTGTDGVHRPQLMPPDLVQPRFAERLRQEAAEQLPPAAAEVLIKAPILFIQPICDLLADPMVYGRCVLIGDAAAVTRPHVGAGTTKAMLAAFELADTLGRVRAGADLTDSLAQWNRSQVARAHDLIDKGAMMGRRAQVEGSWRPGLPELSRITLR